MGDGMGGGGGGDARVHDARAYFVVFDVGHERASVVVCFYQESL